VWAWNAALALVCGDPVIWKPSEKTPLTAQAVMALVRRAWERFGDAPDGLVQLVQGERDVGEALVDDPRIALVSATGSTRMGQAVGPRVAQRFGRSLLELGGNNATIVCPSADLELAARAILFSAAGTAGQRCTTLRRLIVQSITDLAHGLGLSTTAEGVETLQQLRLVRELGCDVVQGYLISPPLEPQALKGWKAKFKRAWPAMLAEEKLALWGDVEADALSEGQV
jgi:aldehyde dehydrogenase (NAD+)